LFFLDNWQSVDPKAWALLKQEQAERGAYRARFGGPFGRPPFPPPGPLGANPNQAKRQERGLNENYGRELMELHTLGVDGGYSQRDVVEVARCFTGWTIRQPQRDPQFWFNERLHDPNPKMVLGHKIDVGGMRDGEEVLDLLARDPHTARHLSLEIARHFVSDNPPAALVDRMTQTYVSTGALLNRLPSSLPLAANRLRGVRTDIGDLLGGDAAGQPGAVLDQAISVLRSGEASQQTRKTLQKQMRDPRVLQANLDDPIT